VVAWKGPGDHGCRAASERGKQPEAAESFDLRPNFHLYL
jgi:hypothetical protein